MESFIGKHLGQVVACIGKDDHLTVAVEEASNEQEVFRIMKETLKIHPSAFRIQRYEALPRMANGKLDYKRLSDQEAQ